MDLVSLPFSPEEIFTDASARRTLETDVFPGYIPRCRWFGGKARGPERFELAELLPLPGVFGTVLAIVRVGFRDGSIESYSLPLFTAPLAGSDAPPDPIVRLKNDYGLFDAIHSPGFRKSLLELMIRKEQAPGEKGELTGTAGKILSGDAAAWQSRVLKVEQSNSSMIFRDLEGHDRLFVKLFRKLEEGVNPDVEITRYLSDQQQFANLPPFGGTVEYRTPSSEPHVVALALGMIRNDGDAWAFALKEVAEFYHRVRLKGVPVPEGPVGSLWDDNVEPAELLELMQTLPARIWQLGVRTGEMHLALAGDTEDPAFSPEPLTEADQVALAHELKEAGQKVWALLSSPSSRQHVDAHALADFQPLEDKIIARAEALQQRPIQAWKTRTHGDYHLGQVLNTGDDFVIIDFEGEPLRPLPERKAKRSPLRDVAGMLRSFHYAAHAGLEDSQNTAELLPWAEAWARATSRMFFRAWRQTTRGAKFLPAGEAELRVLLEAFLLEKALYEVSYELNNRPAWVQIPMRGILAVLSQE